MEAASSSSAPQPTATAASSSSAPQPTELSTDRVAKLRRLARQANLEEALSKISRKRKISGRGFEQDREASSCRYILLREIGRLEKAGGLERTDMYENLPSHAVLVPGRNGSVPAGGVRCGVF